MINSEVSSLDDKKATPMSPGRRAFRVVSAYLNQITSPIWMPAQYVARKFRAGGVKGSIFTLMSAILGAGILTLPYAVYANGLILGPLLILIGALLSYYTGYLLVSVNLSAVSRRLKVKQRKIRGHRYDNLREENVHVRGCSHHHQFTRRRHRLHRLGKCFSLTQIKSLIPQTIDSMSKGKASKFIKNEILWATIVSVILPPHLSTVSSSPYLCFVK